MHHEASANMSESSFTLVTYSKGSFRGRGGFKRGFFTLRGDRGGCNGPLHGWSDAARGRDKETGGGFPTRSSGIAAFGDLGHGRGGGIGGLTRGRGGTHYNAIVFDPHRQEKLALYKVPHDRNIDDGLLTDQPLETLSRPQDEAAVADNEVDIQNTAYLGSYNWVDGEEPTIIVPGSAPQWADREPPFTLAPDEGLRFLDQNDSRMPSSTLLPLLLAVDEMGTEVEWPKVDFITDRNGLRKLMRWIDQGPENEEFRINFELAGERTVLLNRWEPNTKDLAGNGKTFGLAFERETTKATLECEASLVQYRIIKYDFFGLNMVVRYKVDAYLSAGTKKSDAALTSASTSDNLAGSVATLDANSIAMIAEQESSHPQRKPSHSTLRIIRGGSEISQDSIIELTTRSVYWLDQINWSDIYPRLYLSQTPYFYLGVHIRGTFSEIRKSELMGSEMEVHRKAMKAMKTSLRKLRDVLKVIQETALAHKDKRLALVCKDGRLEVYECTSKASCLPDNVRQRFVAT